MLLERYRWSPMIDTEISLGGLIAGLPAQADRSGERLPTIPFLMGRCARISCGSKRQSRGPVRGRTERPCQRSAMRSTIVRRS